MWNRVHILTHHKAGKKFIMKKSIPQKYCEAENKLKDMARTLREVNTNAVCTEVEMKGNTLCLMVREKNVTGSTPNTWDTLMKLTCTKKIF